MIMQITSTANKKIQDIFKKMYKYLVLKYIYGDNVIYVYTSAMYTDFKKVQVKVINSIYTKF